MLSCDMIEESLLNLCELFFLVEDEKRAAIDFVDEPVHEVAEHG